LTQKMRRSRFLGIWNGGYLPDKDTGVDYGIGKHVCETKLASKWRWNAERIILRPGCDAPSGWPDEFVKNRPKFSPTHFLLKLLPNFNCGSN
jgi:hypothetical protein